MNIKHLLVDLGKLIAAGVVFVIGVVLGSAIAGLLGLPPPAPPQGMDLTNAMRNLALTSPILALGLAVLARGLAGSFLSRALVLSFLMWIAYTVNTQLEASIFSNFASGFLYTIIAFAVPALLCGAAVAFLFPSDDPGKRAGTAVSEFWSRHPAAGWVWRLPLAALAFMPVYWFFGSLVAPLVVDYYRQNLFGLALPPVEQLAAILFIRSVLFLLACLPVVALWQKSASSLSLRLGLALFVLVGLVYMLSADWMPLAVRVPHTLEILADEFIYAGILVLLLVGTGVLARVQHRVTLCPVKR